MDSLTQIAVGIATVEAIVGKTLKNKSFIVGAILGTIPDLDVWTGKFFNYETELLIHRGFTHSILGIAILAPILAIGFFKWLPNITYRKWIMIVMAVFATHILIDLFTAWGVQLFYPFDIRISFKTIFVVDIFYTLPWLIGLIMIFRSKNYFNRQSLLNKTFYITSVYLLLTVITKLYVLNKVEETIKVQNLITLSVIVKPTFSNILLWNVNIKTADGYYLGDYSLFDKAAITFDYFQRDIALEQQLNHYKGIQKLIAVSENWYTYSQLDAQTYAFNDLRFGWIIKNDLSKQFVFAYKINKNSDGIVIEPMPKTINDGKAAVKKIVARIINPR